MKATIISTALKLTIVILMCCMLVPVGAMAYTEHPGGTIAADETWTAGTHFVSGTITVSDNIRLTVQAGAVVKFAPGVQLTVYGTLDAPGTATEIVVFTSRDDNAYGDIVSGSDGVPAPGDWYGIYLSGSGDNEGIGQFDHCLLRYGGNASSAGDANLFFNASDAGHFANSISEFSYRDGIRIDGCSPRISNSTLSNNARYGIFTSSVDPRIINSIVWENSDGAISGDATVAYSDI
jgi:hypothetical protein